MALLLHMLAEGCSGGSSSVTAAAAGKAAAAQQQQLALLDVSATAVPAVLAHSAAASEAPAVRFAAAAAARTAAALPSNLPLLLEAALREGSQAAAAAAAAADDGIDGNDGDDGGSSVAGQACALAWELCYSPARGGSLPAAVAAVQQHADLLLDVVEAALSPEQKPAAEGKWLAAGLLACLMFEPAQHSSDGSGAAAAADGMRALLAARPAALALRRLVGLMAAGDAAGSPQAAAMAALAVANMAAYRGSAQSPSVSPRTSLAAGGSGSGGLASAGGSGNYGGGGNGGAAGVAAHDSGVGRLAARAASKLSAAVLKRPSPRPGSPSGAASPPEAPSPHAAAAQQQQQHTDPRGALLHHGAMQRLLRLLISSSSAAARADAAAAAAACEGPGSSGAALTPGARHAGAAAAAAAAGAAAVQRQLLSAALQALNNLCVDAAAANHLRACVKQGGAEMALDLKDALSAAMGDRQLQPAAREYARRLAHTQSGAPGQRHSLACSCAAPPPRPAVYPNP